MPLANLFPTNASLGRAQARYEPKDHGNGGEEDKDGEAQIGQIVGRTILNNYKTF